ncbi:MAG: hypothetical protein CBD31_03425 [Flavobacteriaceae bacterium TMED171]|nr:hypothetical protein [Flavobacteriaceae bacterium]OUW31671.1 MAG: hypothetical protein CBD31_03425 [Flavobacteriaceae bacterium TMED171]|tara:strand:+ start:197 stop:571 length:375 start_codon:yes stop_codon:yes gene_type:complete
MKDASLNIFGAPLIVCGTNPLTGAFRNGCCDTGQLDTGTHTVCAIVTDTFLSFSKRKGNDLTRPYPLYNFPGLVAGDRWCLCILRWLEAYKAGVAPKIILDACHQKTLDYVSLDILKKYAVDYL